MLGLLGTAMLMNPPLTEKTLRVTDFGARPNTEEDATPVFQRVVDAARKSKVPVRIVIPRGTYHFFPTHARRRKAYLSNCTEPFLDATRVIALDLSDLRNVTLDGDHAKFLMRGKMSMVFAERSRNLTLRGVEFDTLRPTVSEITVVEKGDDYCVAEVHRDSKYRIEGDHIVWVGENWEGRHNLVQHYEAKNHTTWRGPDPLANATKITEIAPRRLRIEAPPEALTHVVVNRTYQLRDRTRDEAAMWFSRCRDVQITNVIARTLPSFGLLFQFTQNVTVDGLVTVPAEGSGRTVVAAADVLHFSGCRGQITVKRSLLGYAHDDAINVHGTHLRIVAVEPDGRVRVRFMHPQTFGFQAFTPGDKVEFIRQRTMLPFGDAVVRKVEMVDPHDQLLTLDRPLPPDVELDRDALENATWTPSVEVSHCEFVSIPTRGILVTTRRKVWIHDNKFWRIPMASVLVEDDARGWYESGYVRDLRITDNDFTECHGPVIEVNPQNEKFEGYVHRGLGVERNTFQNCSFPLVSARALDGLSLRGNKPVGVATGEQVQATQCRNVRVEG